MSEQDNGRVSTLQRPATNNQEDWNAYGRARGWRWRFEPEIDGERQKYLAERRAIVPDMEKGIYPFKDIKLSRADVEWLLATHENGRGPVDWDDESQREREGLDLRGADLRGVDLSILPLAKVAANGDLHYLEKNALADAAVINLEEADLSEAHLEGALLGGAYLQGTELRKAHLEEAFLIDAHLERANLSEAHLEEALLTRLCTIVGGKEIKDPLL